MPRIRKKTKKLFPYEIQGEIYRHTGGAFIKLPDGSFEKVGSGKGKYSIRILKLRRKNLF